MTNSANDKLKEIILEPDLHSAGLCRFITTLLSDSFFTPGLIRVLNLIVSIPFRIHGFNVIDSVLIIKLDELQNDVK